MSLQLGVLVVAGSKDDAEHLVDHLKPGKYKLTFGWVDTFEAMVAMLERGRWDIILAEYTLPHFSGLAALQYLKQCQFDIPLIMMSGTFNEDRVISALKAGAQNYVAKDNLKRLATVIDQALQEVSERRRKKERLSQWQDTGKEQANGMLIESEDVLQLRNRELALLNRVSRVFISTLDLDHVLATILEEVRELLGVVACSAWLIDPGTKELVCRQVTDPKSEMVLGWRLPPGVGLVGWVADRGESLIVGDVRTDKRHFKGVDRQTGLSLRSILSAPLRVKTGVIGVLQVVDETIDRFNHRHLALLESLAATVAIAIENGRLYEQARQDAETKAVLLREVNHRVKNNLAAIVGLLYVERRHAGMADRDSYQSTMKDLILRIEGLATVHSMLSAAEWTPLLLSELASQVIHTSLQVLPPDKRISVDVLSSPVRVIPKQANSLALIINELVTNAIKYTVLERDAGRITIHIALNDEQESTEPAILFTFRDDGPGYPEDVLRLERRNIGLYLVNRIVHKDLRGTLALHNDQGAVATIRFKYIE